MLVALHEHGVPGFELILCANAVRGPTPKPFPPHPNPVTLTLNPRNPNSVNP